jgi:aminopeptidase N
MAYKLACYAQPDTSYQEQWITESFADFCSALFEGDYKGRRLYDKNVSAWRSQASDSHEKAPIPLANDFMAEDSRDRFRARRNLLYCKGPVLLNALYEELGDRVFLTWLKSTQATFRWKFATTKQMFDLLTFITKKDYTAFYNNYYWGLALPPKKM